MDIRSPESELEFVAYYDLRWRVLRKPWGQPFGSERDELDAAATHVAGYDEAKRLVCVGRLHAVETGVGQVRYMAVEEPMRGRGLGQASGHDGDPPRCPRVGGRVLSEEWLRVGGRRPHAFWRRASQ